MEGCFYQNTTNVTKTDLFTNGTRFQELVEQRCIGNSKCEFTVEELGVTPECLGVLEARRATSKFSREWKKAFKKSFGDIEKGFAD